MYFFFPVLLSAFSGCFVSTNINADRISVPVSQNLRMCGSDKKSEQPSHSSLVSACVGDRVAHVYCVAWHEKANVGL